MQYKAIHPQVSKEDYGGRIVTAGVRRYFINDNMTVCPMQGVCGAQYFSRLLYSLFCFALFFPSLLTHPEERT